MAKPSQGKEVERNPTTGDKDYKIIMPAVPTGTVSKNTLFLHANPEGRPYNVHDFGKALEQIVSKEDVSNFGVYQYNHVWAITFRGSAAKEKLLQEKEISVKGQRCLVIDPNKKEVEIKLHWIPGDVSDESVEKEMGNYGKVKAIKREKWRSGFFEDVDTTTRHVTLLLREGGSANSLPHQMYIAGCRVLLAVTGRPPMCLRCKQIGHIRRQCQTPWCRTCRSFGHEEEECVRTYASQIRQAEQEGGELYSPEEGENDKQRGTEDNGDKEEKPHPKESRAREEIIEETIESNDEEMSQKEITSKRKVASKEGEEDSSKTESRKWIMVKEKRRKSSQNPSPMPLLVQSQKSQLEDMEFLTS